MVKFVIMLLNPGLPKPIKLSEVRIFCEIQTSAKIVAKFQSVDKKMTKSMFFTPRN